MSLVIWQNVFHAGNFKQMYKICRFIIFLKNVVQIKRLNLTTCFGNLWLHIVTLTDFKMTMPTFHKKSIIFRAD